MKLLILLFISFNSLLCQEWSFNQIGYDINLQKKAIVTSTTNTLNDNTFDVLSKDGDIVYTGNLSKSQSVDGWKNRYFWVADFSEFKEQGTFYLKLNKAGKSSKLFEIDSNLLYNSIFSDQLGFFKGMRNTLSSHKTVKKFGDFSNKTYNVYGGWSDATGDYGKYLSHQCSANYINPQQIPMVVWSLEQAKSVMSIKQSNLYDKNTTEEITWGTDFLLRMLDSEGYFYITIFDGWGWQNEFHITAWETESGDKTANYQAAFREGAGLSIASLARAFNMNISGDSTSQQYLNASIRAYKHTKENNLIYCDNGEENIIDDYTALLAAVELFKATKDEQYLTDAKSRVENILNKQSEDGWFYANKNKTRPYFHAAEEGIVSLALLDYLEIDSSYDKNIENCIVKNANWYIEVSENVTNPFQYSREMIKPLNGTIKESFFIPHTNETGYWWQGENARLASLASMYFRVYQRFSNNSELKSEKLLDFATSQLDWILGQNPYKVCMVYGKGYTNYPHYNGGASGSDGKVMDNVKGGICNGITSKDSDENDIDWMPNSQSSDFAWKNWRWIEQWLPHNAWFTYALSAYSDYKRDLKPVSTNYKQLTDNQKVDIYPDPFSNYINIISPEYSGDIFIYNINGDLVYQSSMDHKIILDNTLHSGVYKIVIKTNTYEKSFTRVKISLK